MRLLILQLTDYTDRAYAYVQGSLGKVFADRPGLDLQGPFFTVAVKEGASEIWHIDWNDDVNTITWVIPVGNWEGGEFCIAQLGVRIPIRPGQVLGVRAKLLAHCSAPVASGKRVVFTCFTDFMVHLKAAQIGYGRGIV